MPASAFAAVTSLEVIRLGEDHQSLFEIIVFTFFKRRRLLLIHTLFEHYLRRIDSRLNGMRKGAIQTVNIHLSGTLVIQRITQVDLIG